jgi:hypothetical protein
MSVLRQGSHTLIDLACVSFAQDHDISGTDVFDSRERRDNGRTSVVARRICVLLNHRGSDERSDEIESFEAFI